MTEEEVSIQHLHVRVSHPGELKIELEVGGELVWLGLATAWVSDPLVLHIVNRCLSYNWAM